MLYIIYMPKKKGGTDNLLCSVIQNYLKLNKSCNGVICAPGYLGKKVETNIKYWETVFSRAPLGDEKDFTAIVTKGMGGDLAEEVFLKTKGKVKGIKFIELFKKTKADHRKMIAFINCIPDDVEKNLDCLIKKLDVAAILIGSSNQNYSTYLQIPASKGEADILIIATDDKFTRIEKESELDYLMRCIAGGSNNYVINESVDILDKIVITKSIISRSYDQDKDFLRSIAEEIISD